MCTYPVSVSKVVVLSYFKGFYMTGTKLQLNTMCEMSEMEPMETNALSLAAIFRVWFVLVR